MPSVALPRRAHPVSDAPLSDRCVRLEVWFRATWSAQPIIRHSRYLPTLPLRVHRLLQSLNHRLQSPHLHARERRLVSCQQYACQQCAWTLTSSFHSRLTFSLDAMPGGGAPTATRNASSSQDTRVMMYSMQCHGTDRAAFCGAAQPTVLSSRQCGGRNAEGAATGQS